jgi:hypothetical protein
MTSLIRQLKSRLLTLLARSLPLILHRTGTQKHFAEWEAAGYHITPVHFYQPIPDTRELSNQYPERSSLTGIDWNADGQFALLDQLAVYAPETSGFPKTSSQNDDHFYLDNGLFVGIDPHIYYCMVRHFRPRKIIEVGAGFSTLIAAQAIQKHSQKTTQLIAVEPYPRDFIRRGEFGIQLHQQQAETLDVAFFDQLEAGDFLFIDSSHVIKTGGDVNYLILDVLPRLAPGVIVHLHDIFLPYEYPREWLLEKHWFWTEQYLLQAFLVHNARVSILIGNHFLEREYQTQLKKYFPDALKWTGGSLWLRVEP